MWGRRQPSRLEIEAKAELAERILANPKIAPIAREAEQAKVQERAALVKRLDAARSAVSPEEARKLQARIAATVQAIEDARKALRRAQDDNLAAMAAVTARTTGPDLEAKRLEAELAATADPRISQFAEHVLHLRDERTRSLVVVVPAVTHNIIGGRDVRYHGNLEEVQAARALLSEAFAAMSALQLEALDRDAVTSRLVEWRDRVAVALEPFGVRVANVTPYEIIYDNNIDQGR
jgi:hypothetical protein